MKKENDITIEERALTLPDRAKAIKISDQKSLSVANDLILTIKSFRKEINASYDPIIKQIHTAHKEAIAKKKEVEAPLVEAEMILGPQIASYIAEQRRIREAAEEKHREEIEAAALKAAEEEEARNKEAEKAMEDGDFEKAEEIMDAPKPMMKADFGVDLPKAPVVKGLSVTQRWKFRIIDETKIPRDYMKPDEVKIGQVIRATKGKLSIPGIQAYPDDSLSTRA